MRINRREFIRTGAAGVMAAGVPLSALRKSKPVLEVTIVGLNAYVFPKADPSKVLVGFFGAAHGTTPAAAADGLLKRMRIRVPEVDDWTKVQMFAAKLPAAEKNLTLEGFRTRFAIQSGDLLRAHPPIAKPAKPNPKNPHKKSDWSPLHWIPDMSWVATAPEIEDGWEKNSNIKGILELKGGVLSAGMPAHPQGQVAIWSFDHQGKTVWRQSIADRVVYTVPLTSPDVAIYQQPLAGGSETKTMDLRADGTLRMVIDFPDSGADQLYPIGTTLDHFAAFYDILKDKAQPRLLPLHRSDSRQPARMGPDRPGPYCPPTRLQG